MTNPETASPAPAAVSRIEDMRSWAERSRAANVLRAVATSRAEELRSSMVRTAPPAREANCSPAGPCQLAPAERRAPATTSAVWSTPVLKVPDSQSPAASMEPGDPWISVSTAMVSALRG